LRGLIARRTALVLLFAAVAVFLLAYLAPGEMPILERAFTFVIVYGGAIVLALALDRALTRPSKR
jgi:hypothetical protein